jgi:hypothetical protein
MENQSGSNRQIPPTFKPKWNSSCLCGSGQKFKDCCRRHLPGSDIGKKARFETNAGNHIKALKAYRADITQYTIWHKSHTEPFALQGIPAIQPMLEIDIKALAEQINELCWTYLRIDSQSEISAVLERLRRNITDPRWQRKITYFHAMVALWTNDDWDVARKEFEKLGKITSEENDVEILQLYIDLYNDQLSFAAGIDLYNRVLALTDSLGEQLQYRAAKATS